MNGIPPGFEGVPQPTAAAPTLSDLLKMKADNDETLRQFAQISQEINGQIEELKMLSAQFSYRITCYLAALNSVTQQFKPPQQEVRDRGPIFGAGPQPVHIHMVYNPQPSFSFPSSTMPSMSTSSSTPPNLQTGGFAFGAFQPQKRQ